MSSFKRYSIYKIQVKNEVGPSDIYIGSTGEKLHRRFQKHNFNNKGSKCSSQKLGEKKIVKEIGHIFTDKLYEVYQLETLYINKYKMNPKYNVINVKMPWRSDDYICHFCETNIKNPPGGSNIKKHNQTNKHKLNVLKYF